MCRYMGHLIITVNPKPGPIIIYPPDQHETNQPLYKNHFTHYSKSPDMKLQQLLAKCFLLLLLTAGALCRTPYPNTGDHPGLLKFNWNHGVVLTAGSTHAWTITPLTSQQYHRPVQHPTRLPSTGPAPAPHVLVETNANGCVGSVHHYRNHQTHCQLLQLNSSTICAGTFATITATDCSRYV